MTDTFTSSPFVAAIEPITETDDEIRAYLAEAEVPPLLPALAYATGDMSLLRPELRPDPLLSAMPQGGLSDEQLADARALALDVLVRFRDQGCRPASPPDDEQLLEMMQYTVGGAEMRAYLPLLEEELAYRGEDRRAPGWQVADVAPAVDFRVLIIGAGMSGLLAAHRLQQAGVPFEIVEKNHDVGGTWLENTYPGCRVDIPNHYYSYSFAQRDDWPLYYIPRAELYKYFRECVDEFGIRPNIHFNTEVTSVEYDDESANWTV
ncbi:MAG: flavin-containing monooxygenase, partial [Acidimicrobiia bacterium]